MALTGIGLAVVLLLLATLVVQVVALVDAIRRPEVDLAGSGGKALWVALLAVGLVVPGGFILALVYLGFVRRRTQRTVAA